MMERSNKALMTPAVKETPPCTHPRVLFGVCLDCEAKIAPLFQVHPPHSVVMNPDWLCKVEAEA